ncbi:MAG: 50S ribosomal protein L1 [Kiritimatiellae bacterium]|jgi:large subunit ribosomal protein L1|nr:50S ribosomal protein L1 [Kiritimatiellia bacterium]
MAKHGKKYTDVAKKAPTEAVSLAEAIAFIKANPIAKFDETMELGMRMGCDSRKSDQMIRGTVSLPHGTGKHVRVAVFAGGTAADAAREAGADFVGNEDLIEKVKGGWTDFDVAIATPEAMQGVRKIARQLGPRGLMPNPKTGTVTDDTAAAVKAQKAGKVEFRMDRQGNICVLFGKLSFEADKLAENAEAIISAVRAERPASAKGQFFRRVTVTSTMGVPVKVDIKD